MTKVTLYRNGNTIITRFTTVVEAENEIRKILQDNEEKFPRLIYEGTEQKEENCTLIKQKVYIYQYDILYTEMFLIEEIIRRDY